MADHRQADAVNWMLEAGITSGTDSRFGLDAPSNPARYRTLGPGSAGRFDPDTPLTRGQVVTFLWRMAGGPAPSPEISLPEATYLSEPPYPFDDVDDSSYYREAAHWASQVGITNGIDERTFGGEQLIDRAQAVTFLHRYHLLNEPQDDGDSEDSGDSEDAEGSSQAEDSPESDDSAPTDGPPRTDASTENVVDENQPEVPA